jgi:hypothetical protein
MAVNKVPETSQMVITIQDGVNAKGQPIVHKRSYKNVKVTAVDAEVYAVAQELANLQTHAVVSVSRQDEGNLVDVK